MVATFATELSKVMNQSEMAFRELCANCYRKGDALGGGRGGGGGGGGGQENALAPTFRP